MNDGTEHTGWPPGLLQDDDRKLSRWFASRPGAKRLAELNAHEIERARLASEGIGLA